MEKVIYSEASEMKDLATKIKERYFLYVGHVDLDTIHFTFKNAETIPKSAKIAELSSIKSAWVRQILAMLHDNRLYCISSWEEMWNDLEPEQKEWLIFDLMYSVHPSCDSRLRKPDVSEHGIICEFLGPYWRRGETPLPSLLGSIDPLPIPPPPMDGDDGATVE